MSVKDYINDDNDINHGHEKYISDILHNHIRQALDSIDDDIIEIEKAVDSGLYSPKELIDMLEEIRNSL